MLRNNWRAKPARKKKTPFFLAESSAMSFQALPDGPCPPCMYTNQGRFIATPEWGSRLSVPVPVWTGDRGISAEGRRLAQSITLYILLTRHWQGRRPQLRKGERGW